MGEWEAAILKRVFDLVKPFDLLQAGWRIGHDAQNG